MSGPDTGRVFNVAGNGSASRAVEGALATQTGLSNPYDVYGLPSGDVLIADNDGWHPQIIRVSATDGRIRAVAGNASLDWWWFFTNGTRALATSLYAATAVCADESRGVIYFSDYYRVASIVDGVVVILGGQVPGSATLNIDGEPALSSNFYAVFGLRFGTTPDDLIIASYTDATVYRINLASSRVYIEAGPRFTTPLAPRTSDGILATDTPLVQPADVVFDPSSGDLFTTVSGGNVALRVFSQNGTVKVIAGNGTRGVVANESTPDATSVSLAQPYGMVLDGRGGLIFADFRNCLIHRVYIEVGACVPDQF